MSIEKHVELVGAEGLTPVENQWPEGHPARVEFEAQMDRDERSLEEVALDEAASSVASQQGNKDVEVNVENAGHPDHEDVAAPATSPFVQNVQGTPSSADTNSK